MSDRSSRPGHSEILREWQKLTAQLGNPFPALAVIPVDHEFATLSDWELLGLTWSEPGRRFAVESFMRRQRDRYIWTCLCNDLPEDARECIRAEGSKHFRIDAAYYTGAHFVNGNEAVMRRVRPALCRLFRFGMEGIKRFRSSNELDDFRDGFILLMTAARLNPRSVVQAGDKDLSRLVQSFNGEFVPTLVPGGFRAQGYKKDTITDADIEYALMWAVSPDSELGRAIGCHMVGYEARPGIGWPLVKMDPREAAKRIRASSPLKAALLRHLILNNHRKCVHDPSANAAWLLARFLKMHLGLHVISLTPYRDLPPDLAWKTREIIQAVGVAVGNAGVEPRDQKGPLEIFRGIENALPKTSKQAKARGWENWANAGQRLRSSLT